MSLLPSGVTLQLEIDERPRSSKTYRLDLESGRIAGFIDELEAVKQFILKSYCTERFKEIIYSKQFGTDWWEVHKDLNQEILEMELKRILKEAIIYDERIVDITNFSVTFEKDSAYIKETVATIYGKIDYDQRFKF